MTATYVTPEVFGTDGFNSLNSLLLLQERLSQLLIKMPPYRRLEVLIVDDHCDTADCLAKLVHCWGYVAQVANDLETGLLKAASQRPQVVLLDIDMPHMDGLALARRLRARFSSDDCLIIALAGRSDSARRSQTDAAGIDLVLLKPVEPAVIQTLLGLESVRAASRLLLQDEPAYLNG